jgi:hypothetical protein
LRIGKYFGSANMSPRVALGAGADHARAENVGQRLLSETAP